MTYRDLEHQILSGLERFDLSEPGALDRLKPVVRVGMRAVVEASAQATMEHIYKTMKLVPKRRTFLEWLRGWPVRYVIEVDPLDLEAASTKYFDEFLNSEAPVQP